MISSNHSSYQEEVDVPTILVKDGVEQCYFAHENTPKVHIPDIIANMDNIKSWCWRLVNTENNSATLISQMPGEGNRLHFHPEWNEWWYIIKGIWKWTIEGKEFLVKEGDFIFIEKGKRHKILAVGDGPSIRLAVSRADVPHVYPNETQ